MTVKDSFGTEYEVSFPELTWRHDFQPAQTTRSGWTQPEKNYWIARSYFGSQYVIREDKTTRGNRYFPSVSSKGMTRSKNTHLKGVLGGPRSPGAEIHYRIEADRGHHTLEDAKAACHDHYIALALERGFLKQTQNENEIQNHHV